MSIPDAGDYDALTFDCYGTLIDWGGGIVDYLQPVLVGHYVHVRDDFLLEFFADTEPRVQAEGGSYAEVLREVLRRLGTRLGFVPNAEALDGFAASAGNWPPFPDTVAALQRLSEHFDLVVVSNVDNAIFASTAELLNADFKHVITAEDVGAYKPDRRMFDAARAALGSGSRILHVAQSLFHDIAPATELGLDSVWIRRDRNAARPVSAQPTWAFDSLAEFADAILGTALGEVPDPPSGA